MPTSSNSSRRSLARTGAVSIPIASSTSSVPWNSAPRGTAIVRAGISPPRRPIRRRPCDVAFRERRVQLVDAEREPDRRQWPAEATEQVVVAPAAADRRSQRGIEDIEDGAGVIAEAAGQAEVEDDPLGDAGIELLQQPAQPGYGIC